MHFALRSKRISLLVIAILVITLAFPVFSGSQAFAQNETAETVFTNGQVYTVEGDNWDTTPQESVAISEDGTILYVGTDKGAEAYVGDTTEVIDLRGKTILPGLGDGHVHPPGTALTEMYNIYLYESITKEKVLADIKAYIEANPDLDAYWGSGFTMGIGGAEGEGKGPKKEWLDEICSDKPIILTSNDGHSRWLNSKAFEMNGITNETTHPTGTVQKDENGELWGTLTDAGSLITMTQTFTDEQNKAALAKFQESMHQWGYTNGNFISNPRYANYLKEMEQAGDWKMRANLSTGFTPTDNLADFQSDLNAFKAARESLRNSEYVHVTTGKFFMDGVVEGMTAYLSEPYDAAAGLDPDYVSVPLWDAEKLKTYFDLAMKEDVQIHVHAIGDQATTETVDALEYAQAQNPNADNRSTITHLQVVKDSDKARMARLGVIGSTQPFWHFKEPEWFEFVDAVALGPERAWKEYPNKSMVDAGMTVTYSGDYPVSPINDPFWAIEAAVTRNLNNADYYGVDDITNMDDTKWLLNPAERVSIKEAVEAYTINVAYQLFSEDTIGSLKAGKKADLIVIDQDIFDINPVDIDETEVVATMFDGEFVYRDATLDNPFTDIENWAKEAILYCVGEGLFNGVSETRFDPNGTMDRGMVVTTLGRYVDIDTSDYQTSPYTDVAMNKYYGPYVAWAAEEGIVQGVGNNRFEPERKVTRQEIAVILDEFITATQLDITETNPNPVPFADVANVATWARDSVTDIQKYGIISGKPGNTFDPLGSLSRAEGATMLMRMLQN